MRLVEIRTYRLHPGCAARFVEVFGEALDLLRASGMDVVAFGRTDHEQDTFHLIRAYADRAALQAEQTAFYASDAWRLGPREALLACIDTYLNTHVRLSDAAIDELRRPFDAAVAAD